MTILKIRNRVLRFLAGLVTIMVIAATGVGVLLGTLYGIGLLAEPMYARMYGYLYAAQGYGFGPAVTMGLLVVAAVFVAVCILAGMVAGAYVLGQKFFDP